MSEEKKDRGPRVTPGDIPDDPELTGGPCLSEMEFLCMSCGRGIKAEDASLLRYEGLRRDGGAINVYLCPDCDNLRVDIPSRFRESLFDRFNPDKAESRWTDPLEKIKIYAITIPCALCDEFIKCCGRCPFGRFSTDGLLGCSNWIRKVLDVEDISFGMDHEEIWWDSGSNKEGREQLSKLRKAAERFINWI